MLIAVIVALAVGTYAFRVSGVLLRDRLDLPAWARALLPVGAAALLAALAATAALTEVGRFAGWARPAGVLVGVLLAWRRAPFVLVVVAAAGTAALLRLAGVP
ncbi:AzlD domain-containing protein [Micromonospora endophytica]|uniref:Branched-chain amino acid transporter n=1 Tax=Micromonospora endophytica TaxID=515350 RepID=A0A2W2CGQ4_9ACTN|nr:AzlD domain-containing protein [Micromonospora endophytica]PZF87469.1 branched-chain amino acid transporter [Micromonospora endophytica]RIW48585.1 AzlD domain-containing protein [Micromonospora endophytica]BCJ61064.1 branched-chain amino acid transporter [Micromonospora endophytica]